MGVAFVVVAIPLTAVSRVEVVDDGEVDVVAGDVVLDVDGGAVVVDEVVVAGAVTVMVNSVGGALLPQPMSLPLRVPAGAKRRETDVGADQSIVVGAAAPTYACTWNLGSTTPSPTLVNGPAMVTSTPPATVTNEPMPGASKATSVTVSADGTNKATTAWS